MSELIWTVLLVGTSMTGVWLAPRTWIGWAIGLGSEALWAAYAITLGSTSLLVMSFLWAGLHARNAVVTYRKEKHVKDIAKLDKVMRELFVPVIAKEVYRDGL